jgi:DNA polymerase-3 subunit delta'
VPQADGVRVAAGTHSGLLVLKRGLNADTGKLMNVLSVDVVRRLAGFFGMTSGAGGWRIAIVDTADDMNDNAANALLKMLEEPPARAMVIVLSNLPGRLLPTIRSRCQRIDLRPLDLDIIVSELGTLLPGSDLEERKTLARLSGGSIGTALQLAGGEGVSLARMADNLIEDAGSPDVAAILALGDKISRMTDGLETLATFLLQALINRIRTRALAEARHLDRWVDCFNLLEASFRRSSALYLEPRQTLLSATRAMSQAARRAGAL